MLAFHAQSTTFTNRGDFTMNTLEKDHRYIWHPCSQMKDYESFKPLHVVQASGSYLQLQNGKKIIDAISSWWCKSLGHGHPGLKKAIQQQIEKFEHVLLVNTTNDTIINLSEKLASLTQTLDKVFYAGDGSSAVEIALKMSLHAQKIKGNQHKRSFLALQNGYHGETTGAMSVSDLGLYRDPYREMFFDTTYLSPLPYVAGIGDALWRDCGMIWKDIEKKLNACADDTAAVIVEPIVQGAGGMKIYSQDFLYRLRKWTKEKNIYLIADECMTGIGRTGKMLACQHANIEPDFLCLSKGLTSGWLPFSAVLTTQPIYDLFYDDYSSGNSFLHSHTYSGNTLGASVALAVLNIIEKEKLSERAADLGLLMQKHMQEISEETQQLKNVRTLGAIVAADLVNENNQPRLGYEVYKQAVERGALLRPLGDTLYWLPPLNVEESTLLELKRITKQAILAAT